MFPPQLGKNRTTATKPKKAKIVAIFVFFIAISSFGKNSGFINRPSRRLLIKISF
jgi:hypothetical protein